MNATNEVLKVTSLQVTLRMHSLQKNPFENLLLVQYLKSKSIYICGFAILLSDTVTGRIWMVLFLVHC